jgi:hypothetical protein
LFPAILLASAALAAEAENGKRLAEARCVPCHMITPGQTRDVGDAPPFELIAKKFRSNPELLAFALQDPHPRRRTRAAPMLQRTCRVGANRGRRPTSDEHPDLAPAKASESRLSEIFDAKRLRRFEINDQLELRMLQHRQIRRLLPLRIRAV